MELSAMEKIASNTYSGGGLVSEKAPLPVGPYPHARKAGNFLYLSGLGPRLRGQSEVPGVQLDEQKQIISYDFELQCHNVFKNVEFVLLESGATLHNLVDICVFLTNMKKDFATFNKIYESYFPRGGIYNPCRTTVEVLSLPTPIAIELKCIAYCP